MNSNLAMALGLAGQYRQCRLSPSDWIITVPGYGNTLDHLKSGFEFFMWKAGKVKFNLGVSMGL